MPDNTQISIARRYGGKDQQPRADHHTSIIIMKLCVEAIHIFRGVLPGTILAITAHSRHLDESLDPNVDTFDGLRFLNMQKSQRSQMVTPSLDFLAFGIRQHLW